MIYRLFLLLLVLMFSGCISQTKEQMPDHKYTNNLINETSPYLLQHAHNPVNWYAWNDETLAKAKKENKLILISVGYAACHWCHVMEEESFENEEVAKLMNDNFINIKVDREERPDVDQVYMDAVQLLTGSGGWPLNCIALPDGRPVWGGTYFPKDTWMNALNQLVKIYNEDPLKLESAADKLTKGVQETGLISLNTAPSEYTLDEGDQIVSNWRKNMDFKLGGTKSAPKFPMPNNYQFLLRYSVQRQNDKISNYVHTTLEKMALGGLYDQVGGGFSRYSVDTKWHIPHFEKMLYDNAQLVSLYADAYLQSKNPLYEYVVKETLQFVERELMHENGAFYASLDADSKNNDGELEEGVFYVWDKNELQTLLGDDFELFSDYFNIKEKFKWENDQFHLYRTNSLKEFAKSKNLSVNELQQKVDSWKQLLLRERSKKPRPRLDDKLLSSWNALMLKGYVDAYRVFESEEYLVHAKQIGEFLLAQQKEDGGLYRNFKEGKRTINAYLEDYATVIDAFISLYQVTFDQKWLDKALALTEYCYAHFYDDESQFFYFTSDMDTALISRKIDVEDNVIPSSNSIMALNLFKLGHYYGKAKYTENAKHMLHSVKERTVQYGAGASNWAQLYFNMLGDFYEIAIVGEDAHQKRKEIQRQYLPNSLIAGSVTDSQLPLLNYKYSESATTLFVCIEGTCKMPVTESEKALSQISVDLN